jgi:hypothetical protein
MDDATRGGSTMTTPNVTEIPRQPEPVGHDPFVDGLRVAVVRPVLTGAAAPAPARPRE